MAIVWYRSDESGRVLFIAFSQACSYGNRLVLLCETSSSECAELAYELSMICSFVAWSTCFIPPVFPKASCTFLFCAMFACDCLYWATEVNVQSVVKLQNSNALRIVDHDKAKNSYS